MKVVKRNGSVEEFDRQKIVSAILKAFAEVDGEVDAYAKDKAARIAKRIFDIGLNEITVDVIQLLIENELMLCKRKDVARAYINYRYLHDIARDQYREMMQVVSDKLSASDVKNQNANVDEYSFGGRIGEASDAIMKQYALEFCMSDMAKDNHNGNMIYCHDLSHYAVGDHNCMTIPFDDLLANGFDTRQTDVRPANSVNTAFQLVAVLFQLQSLQQFGGASAGHLDWTMVPYVRKSFRKHIRDGLRYIGKPRFDFTKYKEIPEETPIDDERYKELDFVYHYAIEMTEREVYQAAEGLFHNLNTLQSRSGCQLPFTSINFGTCTLPEGRMVIKALLDVSISGLGRLRKTPIFPCSIFQCMDGVNRKPGDPNYDLYRLALKSTAKRLYPNYANVDWSGNAGYDRSDPKTYFSTMGCRTANGWDINGFGQLKDGRGNICPVTIILPTLAMMARESFVGEYDDSVVDVFMELLDRKICEAKDMLLERFEWICSQSPKSARFMYENNIMVGYIPKEGIRSALKHGTLAVGQLGLAETLQILIGTDHTTERGMELAKQIEQLFKDRCAEFKEHYSLNFGVYYTPAENLCYTAMKKFKEKYGVIPNVSDRDFFTNSIHVPVWKEMTPFDKIDIESQLTGYSSAGCITYVELGSSAVHNIDALETLVNYAMDHDIPYFAINVPNDTCLECGYTGEFNDSCPMCGGTDIQQLRRVTGYLTGSYKTAFNAGKQQETEMRVQHTKAVVS